jgi:hypothetical protein
MLHESKPEVKHERTALKNEKHKSLKSIKSEKKSKKISLHKKSKK